MNVGGLSAGAIAIVAAVNVFAGPARCFAALRLETKTHSG
jgi:hypothetical protein